MVVPGIIAYHRLYIESLRFASCTEIHFLHPSALLFCPIMYTVQSNKLTVTQIGLEYRETEGQRSWVSGTFSPSPAGRRTPFRIPHHKTQAYLIPLLKHYKSNMFGFNSKSRWSRLKVIWRATRDKMALSGWLGVIVSLVVGIPALLYAYQSRVLADKSMKLAEWTAKKDFLEMCLNVNV